MITRYSFKTTENVSPETFENEIDKAKKYLINQNEELNDSTFNELMTSHFRSETKEYVTSGEHYHGKLIVYHISSESVSGTLNCFISDANNFMDIFTAE